MEIGDKQQVALWYLDHQRLLCEERIRATFEQDEIDHGVKFGKIVIRNATLTEHLSVTRPFENAKLLVGEAIVIDKITISAPDLYFLKSLQPSELKELRARTQAAYKKSYPDSPDLPVHNLDQLIAIHGRAVSNRIH